MSDLVVRYDEFSCTLTWHGVAAIVAVSLAVGVYLACKWREWGRRGVD